MQRAGEAAAVIGVSPVGPPRLRRCSTLVRMGICAVRGVAVDSPRQGDAPEGVGPDKESRERERRRQLVECEREGLGFRCVALVCVGGALVFGVV